MDAAYSKVEKCSPALPAQRSRLSTRGIAVHFGQHSGSVEELFVGPTHDEPGAPIDARTHDSVDVVALQSVDDWPEGDILGGRVPHGESLGLCR